MKRDYKILIIGAINSIYIINFVRFLKKENPDARIYFFGADVLQGKPIDPEFLSCLEEYCLYDANIRHCRAYIMNLLKGAYLLRKSFRSFVKAKHFDIINIHFVSDIYPFILSTMGKVSSNIVLSPWGSDVYRIGRLSKLVLKLLYSKADFVSGVNNRFTRDVKSIFNVPDDKIAYFDLGSATIDYILENKDKVTTEQAKEFWGIDGTYTIACGYNAHPAQQHLKIIESITKIKDQLPDALTLLFPFTYGGTPEYRSSVKSACENAGLKAVFFENFLELPDLFRMRQATDMFVHVQTTDANSTSFGEYMLCGKKIINGSWLRYDELLIDGFVPYFEVQEIDKLDETILRAYHAKELTLSERLLSLLKEKSCTINAQRANSVFEKIS